MQSVQGLRAKPTLLLAALAAALLAGCGGGGSSPSKGSAPTITAQPQSQAALVGESVTFSVAATGKGPLSYQWYRGNDAIVGATGPSFTIGSVASADFATYTVRVTNERGTRTSDPASLTVRGAPAITTQPFSAEALLGGSVTFTVEATGDSPLAYQWSKDGTAIPGATDASYTINPVVSGSAGNYSVVVTNAKGTATSDSVTLTIVTQIAPSITTQPSSRVVAVGAAASFTVVATGTPAPTYQWYKNGVAIAGATDATYTIASTAAGDAGTYNVAAANSQGSVASNDATLTVGAPPTIVTQPESKTVNPGTTVSFSVAASGTAPLSYQWTKNGVPISGATDATYTIAAATASDAGTYRVSVTNALGSVDSANATLAVNTPPVITQQPIIVVNAGSTSVRVVAAGSAPLVYQWYRNGVVVNGATAATYTLGTVNAGNRGVYNVVVSNAAGSVTSDSVNVQ